jgi:hypothetical protein
LQVEIMSVLFACFNNTPKFRLCIEFCWQILHSATGSSLFGLKIAGWRHWLRPRTIGFDLHNLFAWPGTMLGRQLILTLVDYGRCSTPIFAGANERDFAFVDRGAIDRDSPANSMPLGSSPAAPTCRYDQYHA